MTRRWTAALAVFAMGASVGIGPVAPARAATLYVGPGESIQAAVDAAPPGSTIMIAAGTYRESVVITKDGITLDGAGSTAHGTVIIPPDSAEGGCEGFEPGLLNGVCFLGQVDFETFTPTRYLRGGGVRDLVVRGFSGTGVFTLAVRGFGANNVTFERNGDYGLFALIANVITIEHSTFRYNVEPALYIGSSPAANATVARNKAYGNQGMGFFFREAAGGRVEENLVWDNCAGMVFLDHEGDLRTRGWVVEENLVKRNNRVCPGDGEEPPLTGLGIALAGTRNITVEDNDVLDNRPGAPGPFSGGILLFSSAGFGGQAPTGNVIEDNTAFGNQPYDISWDRSGRRNIFEGNDCGMSWPTFICAD